MYSFVPAREWGTPGCGKTTLARLIAAETDSDFIELSAVNSGIKDIKETVEKAKENGVTVKDLLEMNKGVKPEKIKKQYQVTKKVKDEYSIPIVNKRIAVTPISIVGESCSQKNFVKIAQTLDKSANNLGIDFIGGFSALVEKSFDSLIKKWLFDEELDVEMLEEKEVALTEKTKNEINSFQEIAIFKDGVTL